MKTIRKDIKVVEQFGEFTQAYIIFSIDLPDTIRDMGTSEQVKESIKQNCVRELAKEISEHKEVQEVFKRLNGDYEELKRKILNIKTLGDLIDIVRNIK